MTTPNASMILEEISEKAGWDTDSKLFLALEFIDFKERFSKTGEGKFLDSWKAFLEQCCQDEDDELVTFSKEIENTLNNYVIGVDKGVT